MTVAETELDQLDTADLERWLGRPLGGARVKEPMTVTDVRRWVQAMENPNRLHFDDDFVSQSVFGRIVAPQSFTPWWCPGQGGISATFGEIPGAHLSHVGDEWWFYGPRLYPGDHVRCDRMAFDYRNAWTGFAGPSVFQRGDTTYINHRGEIVAKQRTTMLRFSPENVRRLADDGAGEPDVEAADAARADRVLLAKEKLEYYRTVAGQPVRTADEVSVGDTLPRGVIGPHSVASFATQWRARPDNVWGGLEADSDLPVGYPRTTAYADMAVDQEAARIDPSRSDGLYHGPASGHVDLQSARRIGMEREFGFGFAISAWALDYVANWAGQLGYVVHSRFRHKAAALAGDATYQSGSVRSVRQDLLHPEAAIVTVELELSSQAGVSVGTGTFEVRLPWQS